MKTTSSHPTEITAARHQDNIRLLGALNPHHLHSSHYLMPTSTITPCNGDDVANQATLDCVNSNRQKIFQLVNDAIKERDIETIYHYTSASALKSILENKKLWLTRWDFLNDPTEYLYIHDIIDKTLEQFSADEKFKVLIRDRNSWKRKCKIEKRPYNKEIDVYIASFSKSSDNLALWQGYTKSAQADGYCIGFDYHRIFEKQKLDIIIAPVVYSESEQMSIITEIFKRLLAIYINISANKKLHFDAERIVRLTFDEPLTYLGALLKHPAYIHEEELRVVFIRRGGYPHPQPAQQIRNSNGLFIPFVELPFEQERVQCVTASPTLDPQLAVAGLNALKKALDYNYISQVSQIPHRML